jgi:N-acetylglucosamine transport system permease protein
MTNSVQTHTIQGKLHRVGRRLSRTPVYVVLAIWTAGTLFSLIWVLYTSLKTNPEIFADIWALPKGLALQNYVKAWQISHIGSYFFNSLFVAVPAVLLTDLLACLAAYTLGRYEAGWNRPIYYLFMAGMMIPVHLTLIPLFVVTHRLHLSNSLLGLIVIYSTFMLPFSIFVLTSFFRSLPGELADAAHIDGCDEFGLFWRIMLPLASPGVITVSLFNFFWVWNEYILALIMITSPDRRTLPLGIYNLAVASTFTVDWGALFAGLTILMAPTLTIFLLLERRIESGITVGAFK